MDVLDEEIYKCLDELDTLLVKDLQDLSLIGQWNNDEEIDEQKKSVQILNYAYKLLDTNENLKNNTNLLFILKCVYMKHKRLLESVVNYEQFDSDTDLPIESYSLRKYWNRIYSQVSRILVENLIQNDLDDLSKQFRSSEILEFFLLVERSNFWTFYQQIRKERLNALSRTCTDIKQLVEKLIKTLDYEIYLVINYRYIQNLAIDFSDYILIYSDIIKSVITNQLDSIKNQTNELKVNILLNTITQLNRLDEVVKSKSKLWFKLDLPNTVNQKRLQWNYKEYFMKKDYFNLLLNELNKELNMVIGEYENDDDLKSVVSINNSILLTAFVNIIKVLDKYSLIYVKQLKKAFMVIVEVNINQFIQIKFDKLFKRIRLEQIYLYLNTLYFVKENFSNYTIDSTKINELISDLECEFKAKHLFVLNSNIDHMHYYICYLSIIQSNLLNLVNFNLFQAQKLYQDLLQEAFVQLEERDLNNNDLIFLLSNLPDLIVFAYDNEALFISSNSPFQKIVNQVCWKLLYKIVLQVAPIKNVFNELIKFDNKTTELKSKENWLKFLNPMLYSNLVYYHALICNRKSIKHFIFICRPFVEIRFKFTIELIEQLIKNEGLNNISKKNRKNRNRLLKAIFNLITTNVTQFNSLSSIILPFIQGQTFNFDCIQFELLLDDSLYNKHSTKLNQLDWIFSLIKLIKKLISIQFEIMLNNFLYKYIDLLSINELDRSVEQFFNKLNFKLFITENQLLDELTESIFKLACDSVLILPNGLLYSLELIAKELKSNEVLIFNSLTAHLILFAICKQLKSRLKVLMNDERYTILYSKIVGNLLAWLTFPEDHDLNKYKTKFTDLILRRKMNLNLDYIQIDENEELSSLFRLIEINFDFYSQDIDLLDNFLSLNNDYLEAKLNNKEFNGELNLDFSSNPLNNKNKRIRITKIYEKSKLNYDQNLKLLKTSFNYDQLLGQIRKTTNKSFIKNNLIKRSDFKDNDQLVTELKKLFQII